MGPIFLKTDTTDDLQWAQYNWQGDPTDGLRWAQHCQWNVWPMISNGPSILHNGSTDGLQWAQHSSQGILRFLQMGSARILLMVSNAPIKNTTDGS
jgi:hypothetical protein